VVALIINYFSLAVEMYSNLFHWSSLLTIEVILCKYFIFSIMFLLEYFSHLLSLALYSSRKNECAPDLWSFSRPIVNHFLSLSTEMKKLLQEVEANNAETSRFFINREKALLLA
jgi:hypothetical protein